MMMSTEERQRESTHVLHEVDSTSAQKAAPAREKPIIICSSEKRVAK